MVELNDMLVNLARLKSEEAALKWRIKHLQERILAKPNAPEEFDTPYGTLNLRKRDNWSKLKNEDVLEAVGTDLFFKYATFSISSLKKAGGEQLVSKFIVDGKLEFLSVTQYYSLKQEKK